MNVRCPHCKTLFRVDPARIPENGIRAKCAKCSGAFQIPGQAAVAARQSAAPAAAASSPSPVAGAPPATAPEAPRPAQAPSAPAPAAAAEPATPAEPRRSLFGKRDPNDRAHRIARALVSDIVAYHPDRRETAFAAGTLRTEFREEIMKSWEEYVAQVGLELAKSTPFFRQALNDILAKGQSVF